MFAKLPDKESASDRQLVTITPHQPFLSGQVFHMARSDVLALCDRPASGSPDTDVVEIPILLPGWQAMALEDAAHLQGLTVGEMLRHLLADVLPRPQGRDRRFDSHHCGSEDAWS